TAAEKRAPGVDLPKLATLESLTTNEGIASINPKIRLDFDLKDNVQNSAPQPLTQNEINCIVAEWFLPQLNAHF
ncbi:unnamed protein product, partial [Ceratitis capitata]